MFVEANKKINIEKTLNLLNKDMRGKVFNALLTKDQLKRKAEAFNDKLNEGKEKLKPSEYEERINKFSKSLEKADKYISELTEKNNYFLTKYKWHQKKTIQTFQKINRVDYAPVDLIFKELFSEYEDRNYIVEKISEMPNIFKNSNLLTNEIQVNNNDENFIAQSKNELKYIYNLRSKYENLKTEVHNNSVNNINNAKKKSDTFSEDGNDKKRFKEKEINYKSELKKIMGQISERMGYSYRSRKDAESVSREYSSNKSKSELNVNKNKTELNISRSNTSKIKKNQHNVTHSHKSKNLKKNIEEKENYLKTIEHIDDNKIEDFSNKPSTLSNPLLIINKKRQKKIKITEDLSNKKSSAKLPVMSLINNEIISDSKKNLNSNIEDKKVSTEINDKSKLENLNDSKRSSFFNNSSKIIPKNNLNQNKLKVNGNLNLNADKLQKKDSNFVNCKLNKDNSKNNSDINSREYEYTNSIISRPITQNICKENEISEIDKKDVNLKVNNKLKNQRNKDEILLMNRTLSSKKNVTNLTTAYQTNTSNKFNLNFKKINSNFNDKNDIITIDKVENKSDESSKNEKNSKILPNLTLNTESKNISPPKTFSIDNHNKNFNWNIVSNKQTEELMTSVIENIQNNEKSNKQLEEKINERLDILIQIYNQTFNIKSNQHIKDDVEKNLKKNKNFIYQYDKLKNNILKSSLKTEKDTQNLTLNRFNFASDKNNYKVEDSNANFQQLNCNDLTNNILDNDLNAVKDNIEKEIKVISFIKQLNDSINSSTISTNAINTNIKVPLSCKNLEKRAKLHTNTFYKKSNNLDLNKNDSRFSISKNTNINNTNLKTEPNYVKNEIDNNLSLKRINTSNIHTYPNKSKNDVLKYNSNVETNNKFKQNKIKNEKKSYNSLVKISGVLNKSKDNNLFKIFSSVKNKLGITDDLIEKYLSGINLGENFKELSTNKNNSTNSEYFNEKSQNQLISSNKWLNFDSFKINNKVAINENINKFNTKEEALQTIFDMISNKDYDNACDMYRYYTKIFLKNESAYDNNEKKIKPKEILNLLIDYKFKIKNFNVEKTFSEINYGNDHELYNNIK